MRFGSSRVASALLASLVLACATTESAPPKTLSGFLPDYSILEPGGEDEAALIYIKDGAHIGSYRRMILESVTIWYGVGTPLHEVPQNQLQMLADQLYAALYHRLKDDYEFVSRPGPGVLRVRFALTEAEASNVAMDVISTAMPIRPVSGATYLATGVSAFVGTAGIEGEIRDSMTDELLAAAVDRRAGSKSTEGATHKWDDVLASFAVWAERFDERLAGYRKLAR